MKKYELLASAWIIAGGLFMSSNRITDMGFEVAFGIMILATVLAVVVRVKK